MIITRKHLPRRTVLRGLGAALALPLLDGMVPALSALSRHGRRRGAAPGVVYVPNGMMMPNWTPRRRGQRLRVLADPAAARAVSRRLLVLSGLADKYGWPQADEGAGDHARAAATFLTGVHAKKTEGADIRGGVSMDQIAAQALGNETQLASLELASSRSSCSAPATPATAAPTPTPSPGAAPTTPLPMENNPRAVFERLFGGSDSTDRGRAAGAHRRRTAAFSTR